MESTGARGKIHVSASTAEALRASGKEHWLELRTDKVNAKGKGLMTTFWVYPTNQKRGSVTSGGSSSGQGVALLEEADFKPTNERLLDWMVDLLVKDIEKIVSK